MQGLGFVGLGFTGLRAYTLCPVRGGGLDSQGTTSISPHFAMPCFYLSKTMVTHNGWGGFIADDLLVLEGEWGNGSLLKHARPSQQKEVGSGVEASQANVAVQAAGHQQPKSVLSRKDPLHSEAAPAVQVERQLQKQQQQQQQQET